MGTVRTLKGEDGRPYISLEDLIKEVEEAKKYNDTNNITNNDIPETSNFINIVLKTLRNMEVEYYDKYLFKKK
jgi:hypothetical protein